ncbi:MAG: phosphomethylpyrimidine synthase ThiC, partial [Candidatus Thermoplasmatota archaeon]|nr:phosphomethylpyrimidine synthase ThiC [Candidatus Thermoplasmatota archaeon]
MTLERLALKLQEEIKQIAKDEKIDPAKLKKLFLEGRVVIPFNPHHSPRPLGIGEKLRVKINTNIGTSPDYVNIDEEIEKAKTAVKYGSDTIMDLSIGGNIDEIRKKILKTVNLPLGTVPIYQAGMEYAKKGAVVEMTEDDIFNAIGKQAKDGVDFMTVHCGVTLESVEKLKKQKRITGVVSRGGAFLVAWIIHNQKENPLYKNYDYLLELASEHNFTLSLGDGLRPGCIADASDRAQMQELIILGELVERAREKGVQAMVEGPGHIPLNQIEANVRMEKTVCRNAPFYVLGPLVTDIAPGYDHIVGAIGGALAAYYGADFLCYVTPTEHLSLPTIDDVRDGVIASKIAAHAADIARGKDLDMDLSMANARRNLNWDEQFKHCLDPEKARMIREKRKPSSEDTCSMCSELCAIKMVKKYL